MDQDLPPLPQVSSFFPNFLANIFIGSLLFFALMFNLILFWLDSKFNLGLLDKITSKIIFIALWIGGTGFISGIVSAYLANRVLKAKNAKFELNIKGNIIGGVLSATAWIFVIFLRHKIDISFSRHSDDFWKEPGIFFVVVVFGAFFGVGFNLVANFLNNFFLSSIKEEWENNLYLLIPLTGVVVFIPSFILVIRASL